MSWKCDICDSYNEESSRHCYVCGQTRSAESIREGKTRVKAARIARINDGICKGSYKISRMIFFSGLTISLITIGAAIITKIAHGQVNDIWNLIYVLFFRAENKAVHTFASNVSVFFRIATSELWHNLSYNSLVICDIIVSNLTIFSAFAIKVIHITVKNNLSNGYKYSIRPLVENISMSLMTLGFKFAELSSKAQTSVSDLVYMVKGMYIGVVRYFD